MYGTAFPRRTNTKFAKQLSLNTNRILQKAHRDYRGQPISSSPSSTHPHNPTKMFPIINPSAT